MNNTLYPLKFSPILKDKNMGRTEIKNHSQ